MVINDKDRYSDWSKPSDIIAELKVDLIILLANNVYQPINCDEVNKEILAGREF